MLRLLQFELAPLRGLFPRLQSIPRHQFRLRVQLHLLELRLSPQNLPSPISFRVLRLQLEAPDLPKHFELGLHPDSPPLHCQATQHLPLLAQSLRLALALSRRLNLELRYFLWHFPISIPWLTSLK